MTHHFTEHMQELGYQQRIINGKEVILPPLVTIPAGPFIMGSNKRFDPDARKDETPHHVVTVDTFQMAQYPVTVAEFACALDARAIRYRVTHTIHMRISWEDQKQIPLNPVVAVDWKRAFQYTQWLSHMTGETWRLPTEAEWEKAARGADARMYPWGNEWVPFRARTSPSIDLHEHGKYIVEIHAFNSYPSGIAPIDAFVDDVSPYGVFGMAGNVSDWCSSLYRKYPYRSNDGREDSENKGDKVVRGGNWSSMPYSARVTQRFQGYSGIELSTVGFRLVKSIER